jgi:hypothetical protein
MYIGSPLANGSEITGKATLGQIYYRMSEDIGSHLTYALLKHLIVFYIFNSA